MPWLALLPRLSRGLAAVAGGIALLAVAATAAAEQPYGPPIGNNRYKTAIETGPQGVDTDDYIVVLAAGDRLSVTLKSPFQSPLLPELHILDPDGRDRVGEARVKERAGGKTVVVKGFEVDRTGRWAVRVAGRLGSEGPYVVSFKITSPDAILRDGELLGEGTERTYELAAVEGSRLDVDLSWKKSEPPVEILSVEDPEGREVLDDAGSGAGVLAKLRKRRTSLRGLPLGGGDGTYAIRVRAPDGPSTYRVRWRVRPPERATGFHKLESVEPHVIRPAIDPILGVEGRRIRLDAWHLSTGERPRVLFGGAPGRDVLVDASGGFLDVTVPPGVDDSLVDVIVVNPDGQASVAGELFYYVPPPVITAVLDVAGDPAVGGSTLGGQLVRVEGQFLRVGQIVQFGNGPQIIPVLRNGGLEVVTRAQTPGMVPVVITDAFGHEVASEQLYEFKAAPRFAAQPFSPKIAATSGDTVLLLRGENLEATDQLTFDGEPLAFELITASVLRITPPPREDGEYQLRIRDRFDQESDPATLRVKAPGIIDAITVVDGPRLGAVDVSIHGGTVVEVTGSQFHTADRVTLDGAQAVVSSASDGALRFTAAASTVPGTVDVAVTDILGQSTQQQDALHYVGFRDTSAARAPSRTSTDDRSALRGAVGDLDGDGSSDDVVIVSHDAAPGSRTERTRILIGGSSGALVDATATRLPAAGSDASGADDLRAAAVALGDLDGGDGTDILIAGTHPDGTAYGEVRWLVNDGYGDFDLAEGAVPGSTYAPEILAYDEYDVPHEVYSERSVRGRPTALAIGDLDGDGDLDVVVGRSSFESRHFGVDAAHVDFGATPPTVLAADASVYVVDEVRYYAAVRVLENRVSDGDGLVDVTDTAVPEVGPDSEGTPRPAFHARDLALADLDGDGDLDLVVTWDDPTTVTPYGLLQGSGTDTARIATRILLNDGAGAFTDATAAWMPSGSAPELYQATRLALHDLDGDGDADLVLLHAQGVSAYQGSPAYTRSALRVLRNDGVVRDENGAVTQTLGFADVSDAAIPFSARADSDDNLRGVALRVADVDGDGAPDVLVAATTAPTNPTTSQPLPALRLYAGSTGGIAFHEATGFLPPRSTDSGEADDLLLVPDLSSETRPALLILSETVPAASAGSRLLRVFDWQR